MRFLVLAFIGYGFAWWGATLLAGGPNNTGGWGLMYAMLKLGNPPPTVPTKTGSQETSPTSPAAPYQANSGTTPGAIITPTPGAIPTNPVSGFTGQTS